MDEAKRTRYFIEMNDTLIRDVANIALVNRRNVIGYSRLLKNIDFTPWDFEYWNIGRWTKSMMTVSATPEPDNRT